MNAQTQQNQPYNEEMERVILGAFMEDEGCFWDVIDFASVDMFYVKEHKVVFSAIRDLALRRKAFRLALLSVRVKLDNALPLLGAMVHSYQKASEKSRVMVVDEVDELARLHGLRKIQESAQKMLQMVSVSADPSDISITAIEEMSHIVNQASGSRSYSMREVVQNTKNLVAEAAKSGGGYGIQTELPSINELIGAMYPTDLILLGATPGGGKTSLALQIALDAALRGYKGAFFQLEMDHKDMFTRLISGMAGLTTRDVYQGLKQEQFDVFSKHADGIANAPLTIIDSPNQSLEIVKAKALSIKKKAGLDFMVLDHIGLIKSQTKYKQQQHEMIAESAKDLKQLAKHLQIPILCLCQLTRTSRQKENPKPAMEDFLGSSLEQDADVMLCAFDRHKWMQDNPPTAGSNQKKDDWWKTTEHHKNKKEIYLLKNRKSAAGQMRKMYWNGAATRFEELKPSTEEMDF